MSIEVDPALGQARAIIENIEPEMAERFAQIDCHVQGAVHKRLGEIMAFSILQPDAKRLPFREVGTEFFDGWKLPSPWLKADDNPQLEVYQGLGLPSDNEAEDSSEKPFVATDDFLVLLETGPASEASEAIREEFMVRFMPTLRRPRVEHKRLAGNNLTVFPSLRGVHAWRRLARVINADIDIEL